jgi:hypothetical protein
VILSEAAVQSKWVEREWQAKYWEEIGKRRARVIPVLKEKCKIPMLLRPKKYADFTVDYSRGLTELLEALAPNRKTRPRLSSG